MSAQVVQLPYAPRRYILPIHNAPQQFQVVIAHRRAGKTVGLVNHLLRAAIMTRHPAAQFAYVAPTYKMAKRIAWKYLKHYAGRVHGFKASTSELTVGLGNGSSIMLMGADSVDDLRGIYLHGSILDEYALMSPRLFPEVILPTLMDYEGFCIQSGTPLGNNQLKRSYIAARDGLDGWRAHLLRASDTRAFPNHVLERARANMSPEQYAQEFECSFDAVVKGAYYGELMAAADRAGRITKVDYDPALGVICAVDLGMRDAFACGFFQEHASANQVRMINYVEFHGKGLPQVKAEIDKLPYKVAHWIGPHDLAVRELGTGRSRIEVARGLGMNFAVAANLPLEDGREAVRQVLPSLWIDAVKCETFIDAMRQHRALFDEDKEIEDAKPVHDWTSHPADMFRYYCVTRPRYSLSNWGEAAGQRAANDATSGGMRRRRRG